MARPDFKAIRERAQERRSALETARTMKVQRLQQDIDRIVKREREYSQTLLNEIVPVRVVWNDEAWKRLQDLLPFRVESVAPKAAAADGGAPEVAVAVDAAATELVKRSETIPGARDAAK
jgi:hypothetical protein